MQTPANGTLQRNTVLSPVNYAVSAETDQLDALVGVRRVKGALITGPRKFTISASLWEPVACNSFRVRPLFPRLVPVAALFRKIFVWNEKRERYSLRLEKSELFRTRWQNIFDDRELRSPSAGKKIRIFRLTGRFEKIGKNMYQTGPSKISGSRFTVPTRGMFSN